jgi:hypothetical protein
MRNRWRAFGFASERRVFEAVFGIFCRLVLARLEHCAKRLKGRRMIDC